MKFNFGHILLFLLITAFGLKSDKSVLIVFLENSSLQITGKTNVSKFSCAFDFDVLKDSLQISYQKKNNILQFRNAVLHLQNKGFDCGGKAINKDFHKLLKTEKYPQIKMRLKHIEKQKNVLDSVFTNVEFTINNITKAYKVQTYFCKEGKKMEFCGSVALDIADYELKPPKKVLGLVKVKNEINVSYKFNAYLKEW